MFKRLKPQHATTTVGKRRDALQDPTFLQRVMFTAAVALGGAGALALFALAGYMEIITPGLA